MPRKLAPLVAPLVLLAALACTPAEVPEGSADAPTPADTTPADTAPTDTAPASTAPASISPPNVILVLADTLRADHVGSYGHHRDTTPFLDRLAAEGALFTSARAQAPCTYPSANSLLTSRDPAAFLGRPAGEIGIPPEIPTLAEMLKARGYATHGVSASPIVRATPSDVNLAGGFGQGFDTFHEGCLWLDASCVKRAAWESLEPDVGGDDPASDPPSGPPRPYFLYLHFMDPHDPYKPPPWATLRFADDGEGHPDWVRKGNPNPIARKIYGEGAEDLEFGAEDLDHLLDLYDDEIAWFDEQLEEVVEGLQERGAMANTLMVIVSDHGESFYEAGHMKHCRSLDDREIRTPLILHGAGVGGPHRVDRSVANLDVVPTILEAVERSGIKGLGQGEPPVLEGRSLWPYLERDGEPPPEQVVFSSIGVLRAAVDDRYKLTVDLARDRWRLHDLDADPTEATDLLAAGEVAGEHRRAYRRLRSALEAWMEATKSWDEEASRDVQRKLKALGYLQ